MMDLMLFVRYGVFVIISFLFVTDVEGYKRQVSFPSWNKPKYPDFAVTTSMECDSFIK